MHHKQKNIVLYVSERKEKDHLSSGEKAKAGTVVFSDD